MKSSNTKMIAFLSGVALFAQSSVLSIAPAFATSSPEDSSQGIISGESKNELIERYKFEGASIQETESVLNIYIHIDPTTKVRTFDSAEALKDGASQDLLELGEFYNSIAGNPNEIETRALSIPIHGRYCGPGHSGPGNPIDTLDRICMEHDRCYASKGYGNRTCDVALRVSIYKNLGRMGWGERAKAIAVAAVFGGRPIP